MHWKICIGNYIFDKKIMKKMIENFESVSF
jgi:ADP-glucose pyrophosphorylase